MTTNPYQPPAFDPKQFQDQPAHAPPGSYDAGWVRQVRIFAILNAVQGLLEIPIGLMTGGIGVLFPVMLQMEEVQKQKGGPEEVPEGLFWAMSAIYLAIGIPVLICGALRLVAAYRNYYFQGRTLGIVSICAGAASILTCNCAPTAIGLMVYGLILFLNPAVKIAFEMARQGHTADQILAAFSTYTAYSSAHYSQIQPLGTSPQPDTGPSPFGPPH
jgi:hypothetical protein